MDKIQELMKKYRSGEIGVDDLNLLEEYIEKGVVDVSDIEDLDNLHSLTTKIAVPEPGPAMRSDFYANLSREKRRFDRKLLGFFRLSPMEQVPIGFRWAYSLALLVIGVTAGWLMGPAAGYKTELSQLNDQMLEMKEIMMIDMLQKNAVTDRLKAVSLGSELSSADIRVVEALLQTLQHDENVNVRLATLDVLINYADRPEVREGLIQSIQFQDSPLVQMSLAELMVQIQEKKSVPALRELLDQEGTTPEAKQTIQESIGLLI